MNQKSERSVYTAQDFLQWRETSTLELTPKFQRRGVWTTAARSYFIDTILRQMPVPPIYIRVVQSKDAKRQIREVIDGQQRISAILDFVDGKFKLSRTLSPVWAGKTFDELTADERNRLMAYSFSTELFRGLSDLEVLEIFGRLNTYSVPLNAQELRNGTFFGLFKQSVYGLAHEHLEFWRRNGIFSERSIARMLEVELTSELVVVQIAGMQDKKNSIDDFYAKYDDEYPALKSNERRFKETIDVINETFPDGLREFAFSRAPLFYSLYCTIYHRQFGIRGVRIRSPKKPLKRSQRLDLANAVARLSEIIAAARADQPVSSRYDRFVAACLRQTDNIKPRQQRLKTLYETAFMRRRSA